MVGAMKLGIQDALSHNQGSDWALPAKNNTHIIEIYFNEMKFKGLLEKTGLEVISTHTLHEEALDVYGIQGRAVRTYVFRKKNK